MRDFCFIVPIYNINTNYVDCCIKSLINQTNDDKQIIIVDDGSYDECSNFCDLLAKNYEDIVVVHKSRNEGVSKARTAGLELCDSKMVLFVDGDDWLDNNVCEKILEFCLEQQQIPDITIFSGYRSYPSHEDADDIVKHIECWENKYEIDKLQTMLLSGPTKNVPIKALSMESVCAKAYSYDFIINSKVIMPDIPYREDGLYIQMLLDKASLIIQLPFRGYHYRMTAGSTVNSFRENSPAEQFEYLSRLFEFAQKKERSAEYKVSLYYAAFISMQICITQYFFHPQNKEKLYKKHLQCKRYLSQWPYSNTFKTIPFSELRRNHKIKAFCIRCGFYSAVTVLRNVYLKRRKNDYFE